MRCGASSMCLICLSHDQFSRHHSLSGLLRVARYLVPYTWYPIPDTWYLILDTWYRIPDAFQLARVRAVIARAWKAAEMWVRDEVTRMLFSFLFLHSEQTFPSRVEYPCHTNSLSLQGLSTVSDNCIRQEASFRWTWPQLPATIDNHHVIVFIVSEQWVLWCSSSVISGTLGSHLGLWHTYLIHYQPTYTYISIAPVASVAQARIASLLPPR